MTEPSTIAQCSSKACPKKNSWVDDTFQRRDINQYFSPSLAGSNEFTKQI